MERQVNETYFEYLKRLTEMLEQGIINYNEFGDALLGAENTYSADNLRKAFYVIRKLVPRIDSDITYTENDDIKYQQYRLMEQEAYKASVKLRDQRREMRKYDMSEARFEHLVDEMRGCMKLLAPLPHYEYNTGQLTDIKGVLMLSDWHYGAKIDSRYNYYDTETCEVRAAEIFDKCVKHCMLHKVSELFIEINGDMIHGLINVSNRVQSEEDVVEQIVHVSELLASLINSIKPYFKKITVVSTFGNHGRLVPEKNQSVTKENFERLINEFLRLRLDGITIIDTHSEDHVVYNVGDKTIYVAHGQYEKLNSIVGDCVSLVGVVLNEIHLGHTHSYKDIVDSGTIITVNGSLMGTDDYALTLRKNTKPSQTLIVYGEDRCVYQLGVE